jgi:ketosteroid isomerase-like protein
VELVRSIFEAWERGDYNSAEWAHPEVETVYADGPAPGRWMGFAGMAESSRDWLSAWEDFRFVAEDYRELDAERVAVLVSYTGRGKTSGLDLAETRTLGAVLFEIRGGKVTRIVRYLDRDHAFADLGLAPEAT